jgi:hypothetical protein
VPTVRQRLLEFEPLQTSLAQPEFIAGIVRHGGHLNCDLVAALLTRRLPNSISYAVRRLAFDFLAAVLFIACLSSRFAFV